MMQKENRQPYKRYNTESDKKCLRKRLQQSVEEINQEQGYSIHTTFLLSQNNQNYIHSTDDYFLQDTSSQENENFTQQSRYMTCYNENYDDRHTNEKCLSFKASNLMRGLKQLIKELCLTKNSNNQVQEELQRLIVEFQETSKPSSTKFFERSNNNPRELSCLSEIRVRTIYQIEDNSFNLLTENEPYSQGLKLFHPFLSGTSFESEESQIQTRLTHFQRQLLSQYLEKYLSLLQKQINRISRYNGQKKLKYLLSTVMKQIFTQIMRFTYQTKISMAKKQANNLLNNFQLKINLLASTLQRMLNTNNVLYEAFSKIKNSLKMQQKADIKLINKFESKINYLNNLLKFRSIADLREKFLKWRRNSTVIKETERIFVMDGIKMLAKEILYEFALNESNLERWKFIVWGRLNQFIKSICNVGECVLFPVEEELLQNNSNESLSSSVITESKYFQSRISSNNNRNNNYSIQSSNVRSSLAQSSSPNTFRSSQFSPNQQDDQTYLIEKKLLDEVHQNFSLQEIKGCLQNGEIIMHDIDLFKIILIPIKSVAGIIVVKYQINTTLQNIQFVSNEKPSFMNVNSFYNILNALQLSSPLILDLMTVKQKFEYFSSRIEQKSHHKFIISHLLAPQPQKFNNFTKKVNVNFNKNQIKNKSEEKISEFISIEQHDSTEKFQREKSLHVSHEQIDNLLIKMNVKKVLMYHRKDKKYFTCLNYASNSQPKQEDNRIGKEIVDAIFTQLEKINKNIISDIEFQPKCLYLKKSNISFYACPLIQNNQIIGFVELHLEKDFHLQGKIPTKNFEDTFIVKTVDTKSQILNETIAFVTDVVIPMIVNLKIQRKQMNQQCQICNEFSKKKKYQVKKNHNDSDLIEKPCKNILQLHDINRLFMKISQQTKSCKNRTYEIEKIFTHEIENYHSNNMSSLQNSSQQNNLTSQQFFTKIFYLTTPRTKDNKLFNSKKQNYDSLSENLFYHTDFQTLQGKKKQLKLPFIDMLKLFNFRTKPEQFEQQTKQIGVSKLNEIYRSMLRKMNSSQQFTVFSQEKQNNLQTFIEEILKSTLIKSQVLPLEAEKKYHALQLWLYQMQHMNKKYGGDKYAFRVSIYPVFSVLDSKNRFLSAIVCSGGVIVKNQNISERKNNCRNLELNKINEFTFKLAQQVLARIVQIQIKNQSFEKSMNKNNVQQKSSLEIKSLKMKNTVNREVTTVNVQRMTPLEKMKLKMYNKSQTQIHQIISSFINFQNQLKHSQKIKVKEIITQKFHQNLRNIQYKTINQLSETLQRKVINKNLTTKFSLFYLFIQKLSQQKLMISQRYLMKSLRFVQKMSNVFIRNKMLNNVFQKLKNLTYQNQSQIIDKLFSPSGLKITKKFAPERIYSTIKNKIYNKSSQESLTRYSFMVLKDWSSYIGEISQINKRTSLVKLNSAIQKLICKKYYLPYFQNLIQLQKSLYQSISLIGTEIQTINFYSIHQFLTFVNERISIIINSEKRLIQILYGHEISKVNVQIITQNLQTNQFQAILISDYFNGETIIQETKKEYFKNPPILIMEKNTKKFYVSLELQESQTSYERNQNFKDLRKFIENVLKTNVSSAFEKFMTLHIKKIDTFVMKLSKFLKTPFHQSKKNQSSEAIENKKQDFKIFMDKLLKLERMKKIEDLQHQIEIKSNQLSKLSDFHEKRSKKLMAAQTNSYKSEMNMNQFIAEQLFDDIVSKKHLKQMKKNIQNMDINSENLSLQYQIKSKTVAGHQMMEIIDTRERKQAFREVFSNLSIIVNQESTNNLYSTNTFFLSSMRKQMLWSATSRKLPQQPIVDDVIVDEKQRLNYSLASHIEQKNYYSQKFKKAGIKSINKILNNICRSTFGKSFYRIHSFSWINSPKLIR